MKITTIFLSILATAALSSAQESGAALFEQKCSACHVQQRPSPQEMKNLIAPPIMGVMKHIKEVKTTKAEAVVFIVDYLYQPTQAKAMCLPQSIKRFGLMPSQKENVTKEEATIIAGYLFDNFGSRGMGNRL